MKSLFLILFCLLILPLSLTAQDDFEDDNLQLEDPPKALLVDPPKDASTIQAANDIWYSNNGSDRYIDLWWSVQHSCFWGGTHSLYSPDINSLARDIVRLGMVNRLYARRCCSH